MKKGILTITAIALMSTTLAVPAITQGVERGYININTSAETEVAPDVAEISFAIRTTDTKSIQKATVQNKEVADKVLVELSSLLNSSNGDYIKTSDFNASPIYSYNGNKKSLERYEVSNRVIVHTKSLDKIGKMIDRAIELGATNVDNLNFSVSNYDNKCNDLIVSATKKAHDRAGLVAKTTNSTLDGIRSFDANCSENNNYMPRMYKTMNVLSSSGADSLETSSTSISGGIIKIRANINASFFVK